MEPIECPVCTLYLREGMSLSKHLHTHPKAQVIEALSRLVQQPPQPVTASHLPKLAYHPQLEAAPCQTIAAVPSTSSAPPIIMEPPQLTSILYHQQFLSSTTTTSFMDPACLPPPPQLIMMAPTEVAPIMTAQNPSYPMLDFMSTNRMSDAASSAANTNQQLDLIEQQQNVVDNNCQVAQAPTTTATFQYPQLDNLNFQRHTQTDGCTSRVDSNSDVVAGKEVMNIGTVITDSQKAMSNSPGMFVVDQQSGPSMLVEQSSGKSPPHSPCSSSNASAYSVRVRQDLRTPSPAERDEYIVPGFEFDAAEDEDDVENCNDDDDDDNSEVVDDCGLSMPLLNIHTDESMPAQGELSGHGTSSCDAMWQTNEVDLLPAANGARSRTFLVKDSNEEGVHILPDSSEDGLASVIRREHRDAEASLIQFSSNTTGQRGIGSVAVPVLQEGREHVEESFSSVFIQPKKEQQCPALKNEVKDEIPIVKMDAEGRNRIGVEVKRKVRTCLTCDEKFPTMEEYLFHLRKVHPLECKACGKCFTRTSGLTLHQKRHLKIKPYKCTHCEKSFVTNQKLTEHYNIHTGESPFKCTMCEKAFKRYSNLIQHKKMVHLKLKRKVKDFVCFCGEVFHSQLKFNWHKEKHDNQPKKCSYCTERFVHASSLTRHIRRAHDQRYIPAMGKVKTEKENVECPVCKRVCLRTSLRTHMLKHSGIKPFVCNTCGKRFFSKWNMKLHLWTHASRSSLPFKCKLKSCKAAFVRESDYQAHLRAHRNQRQYSCNYCGRQFIRKYNCIRHTREHERSKMHACTVCGKTFHRGYYLTEHMRTHTGVKPFTCHICSKTTATKTNHNKHLKTHHAHAREIIASEN